MLNEVNWQVFTKEEEHNIKGLYQTGDLSALTQMVEEITREKEIELQKIINRLPNEAMDFDSKVKKKYWNENPDGPQTPEEEAELQRSINTEFEKFKEKLEKSKKKKVENLSKKKTVKKNKEEIKK